MIVVIGSAYLLGDDSDAMPDGLAGRVALAGAASGSTVELITKVGDDPAGDALLLALARARVGHVAVLRDAVHHTASRPRPDDTSIVNADDVDGVVAWVMAPDDALTLEAADVDLALRYLTDYRVIVAVFPSSGILAEAAAAADWAGAHLVVATRRGDGIPASLPAGSLVLEIAQDPADDSAVGRRLGAYAASVDSGDDPATAFAALTAEAD